MAEVLTTCPGKGKLHQYVNKKKLTNRVNLNLKDGENSLGLILHQATGLPWGRRDQTFTNENPGHFLPVGTL